MESSEYAFRFAESSLRRISIRLYFDYEIQEYESIERSGRKWNRVNTPFGLQNRVRRISIRLYFDTSSVPEPYFDTSSAPYFDTMSEEAARVPGVDNNVHYNLAVK